MSLCCHPIFEESHIGFPLPTHTSIRRGLPRPRFSLTAHLVVVGNAVILSMNAALCTFTSQFNERMAAVGRKLHMSLLPHAWLYSFDRSQLSLESFTLSPASVPVTWLSPPRPPSWTFCWMLKPCCAANLLLDLVTTQILGLLWSVAPRQQKGFCMVYCPATPQLNFASPKNGIEISFNQLLLSQKG